MSGDKKQSFYALVVMGLMLAMSTTMLYLRTFGDGFDVGDSKALLLSADHPWKV